MAVQYPDITRDDAGMVLINQWDVGTRERQRAGADAIARQWRGTPMPDGALSLNLYVSDDGGSVLAYEPWTGHDAYQEFAAASRGATAGGTAPGIARQEPVEYRLYRSSIDTAERTPGSIVIVQFDTRDQVAARTLVDTLIDGFSGVELPDDGSLGAHFHIALDGTRMLNYAEFVDAASHEALINAATESGGLPDLLSGIEGIKPLGFRRYTLHTSVSRTS